MLPLPLADDRYETILVNALNSAANMLARNSEIYKGVLPEDMLNDYSTKNDSVENRLRMIASKVETQMNFSTYEVSYINRALMEYVDSLELAQSHYIYMTEKEDLGNLSQLRTLIEDVYLTQLRFNDEVMRHKVENDSSREISYDVAVIVKALNGAKNYVKNNAVEIEETLASEDLDDLKDLYLERNNMALFAIEMATEAVESGRPLNPADVSVVNKAMVQYIQKLETAQSNMIYTVESFGHLSHFKNKIEDVHFQMFKFNETYPTPKMLLPNQPRISKPKV